MTDRPSPLGNLIHQLEDNEGLISIYEKHNLRYLTFGNQTEQSCLTLDKPHRLEHAYTQAMMLSLLFKDDIRSALLLGLGGGSLARALRHFRARLKIDAIEYRQSVIDIAMRFFDLPNDSAFNALCDNAYDYISSTQKQYDLIFSDLYLPKGMDEVQLNDEFLKTCRHRLSENGVLIVNLWSYDFQQSRLAQEALKRAFGENVLSFHVQGGNDIAFAFKSKLPNLEKKSFFAASQQMALRLDIPLQRMARSFWVNNAQKLHLSRLHNR